MSAAGPSLEALTRRLAACPPELRGEPRRQRRPDGIHVDAIVADVVVDLGGPLPPASTLASFVDRPDEDANRLRLVLLAAWVLHDRWFREAGTYWMPARGLLTEGLHAVAALLPAERFVADPERREELVRLVLAWLGLHPRGEKPEQAADRLRALDTVERDRVVRETRARMEHAQRLREAMARKEAEEAAARYGRE